MSKLTPDEIGIGKPKIIARVIYKRLMLGIPRNYTISIMTFPLCVINGVEKLIPNLNDKEKCVVHIKALNQALKHSRRLIELLSLTKVHG